MSLAKIGIEAIEKGWVPDRITRFAIGRLCHQRLLEQRRGSAAKQLIAGMRTGDIAPVPEKANEQHYEVSAQFYQQVLGPQLKYSSCYFENPHTTLADAETAALKITCQRAELVNGQRILELGCGWGSLSLWMAQQYPGSQITAVSNSASQREFINAQCVKQDIKNLTVITADMNDFSIDRQFDRVVSVEMFEHMRNYQRLLKNIASWLVDDGKLFVHIFCNANYCYPFESAGATNWMGRYFFTGGIMPSFNIFQHFQDDMSVEKEFRWDGTHYQRTLECWLENLDARRTELTSTLADIYGEQEADRWVNRWRMFFMGSAETFGFEKGNQWFVAHYLLKKS